MHRLLWLLAENAGRLALSRDGYQEMGVKYCHVQRNASLSANVTMAATVRSLKCPGQKHFLHSHPTLRSKTGNASSAEIRKDLTMKVIFYGDKITDQEKKLLKNW